MVKGVRVGLVKPITIKDECGVIGHLQELALKDCRCEHCAIAIADETDHECRLYSYCMVQDLGGETSSSFTVIPRRVSYALLNLCNKEKKIPVILHTHIVGYEYSKPLGFSPQDIEFVNKFLNVAKRMESIFGCLFIVMNGEDLLISFEDLDVK